MKLGQMFDSFRPLGHGTQGSLKKIQFPVLSSRYEGSECQLALGTRGR
jgi:hypothetical protein